MEGREPLDQEEGMIDDAATAVEAMLRLCDVSLSLLLACLGFHHDCGGGRWEAGDILYGGGSDSDSWMGAATLVFVRLDA